MDRPRNALVHPTIERLAAYAWRIITIAIVAIGAIWLVGTLWVVFLPLVIAAFLSRVLITPVNWLRRRGWKPALSAGLVLVLFLLSIVTITGAVGVAIGRQAKEIAPTLSDGIDDIETWLVTDAPGDLDHDDIRKARDDASKAFNRWVRTSGGTLVSGAVVAFELLISIVLGLIITFFALKDGARLGSWLLRFLPEDRRAHAERLSNKAWATLGGYLRGAALLGLLEGFVIGVAMALLGAKLAVPIAVLTFLLAFVPFAGAIVAGILAVLVTLATAGPSAAAIVAIVALVVQQLDNDLLAPVIYGKALDMHPVTVLLSISAGGALFGLAGTFLAVPATALTVNVVAEHRASLRERAARDRSDPDDGPEGLRGADRELRVDGSDELDPTPSTPPDSPGRSPGGETSSED